MNAAPTFDSLFLDPIQYPSLMRICDAVRAHERTASVLAERFISSIHVKPSPLPAVLQRNIFDWSQAVASERAQAVNLFLQDVYGSFAPRIYEHCPHLKRVLDTNPYFVPRLVGVERAHQSWNIDVAFDWTITCQQGLVRPAVIESDSCAIGGLLTCAIVYQRMVSTWRDDALFSQFEDGRANLKAILSSLSGMSQMTPPGSPVIFVEGCLRSHLTEPMDSWLQQDLLQYGFRIAGPWNRHLFAFDPSLNRYRFDGTPISFLFLHYYPCCFDQHYPEYANVPNYLKDEEQVGHAVNGFWSRYEACGRAGWGQTNPLGAELTCDKATASFIPDMIRCYLDREPVVSEDTHRCFITSADTTDVSMVEQVFSSPTDWVVKSRRDSGQGVGVFCGNRIGSREWNRLRERVISRPLDYVAQPLISDIGFTMPDGDVRAVEFRNVVQMIEDVPMPINQLLIRTAPLGEPRNLSTNPNCRLLPLLVPKSREDQT